MYESKRFFSMLKIMAMAGFFAMLFILSGGFQPAHAACTKFVSPTGSNSNNGTAYGTAWQTVQYAFDHAVAGDTVCFERGLYGTKSAVTATLTTTFSSTVTFTNFPGDLTNGLGPEVAIIQGTISIGTYSFPLSGCTSTSTCAANVTFQGTPNLNPGLIFEGPAASGDGVVDVNGSNNITFDHVEITDSGSSSHAGFYQYYSSNVSLTNSYIHDNGDGGDLAHDQGVYWDATHPLTGQTGGLIANNVVEHNNAGGIQLFAGNSGQTVSDVTVTENTVVENGYYGMIVDGNNNIIVNNILSNNAQPTADPQMYVGGSSLTIDENLIWCDGTGCCTSGSSCTNDVNNASGQNLGTIVNSDPDFVDAQEDYSSNLISHHNYRLKCGGAAFTVTSPAFHTQSSSYVQSADKDGVSRSSVSALGAYVY